ncbi:rRNA maturation RNase YbeY [Candidatus Acidulodesulfobacterium sp. H_13]|uniref:rRNA maturation RNase YbeY n=1 Tax=Candidatus Acidulodesulfobacterium sp. H_13 TaxID=3395470 RepID=UPI003AF45BC5
MENQETFLINITNTQRRSEISPKLVYCIVKNSLKHLFCGSYGIDIIFCSPSRIKKLNKDYRNRNNITDVLSFEIKEYDNNIFYIGEIYIAPAVAENNFLRYRHFWEKADWISRERGEGSPNIEKDDKKGFEKEIALLIIHGILHLFGYVHDEEHELDLDDEDYNKEMKDMQKLIYKNLDGLLG